jgi:5-formyltetrahydrofolate cyclo-ligase
MTDKKNLRKEIIRKRSAMASAEVKRYGESMCAHLEDWLLSNPKRTLFLYSPIRNEPDLTSMIGQNPNVRFALPVVLSATEMLFYTVDETTTFTANRWGVLEPEPRNPEKICRPDEQTLVVIPALAADVKGYRLGYGAGYYDRYLQHSKAVHMVAVFSAFILEKLNHETHDIKGHYLLSEGGVGEC